MPYSTAASTADYPINYARVALGLETAHVFIAQTATLFIATTALVQAHSDYLTKPVKIIVPFPPGGTSDVMARMLADELTKSLKQPFIIENIGGAGGTIGTERASKMPADG